jgi:dienelactone hydrolase
MMGTRVSYLHEQQPLEGYLAAPESARDLPGVLIVPSWLNVNESICRRADRLAELGYAAFVADLFGAGVRPGPPQSPVTVVGPFLDDRFRFRRRPSAGLRAFRERPECNRFASLPLDTVSEAAAFSNLRVPPLLYAAWFLYTGF